MSNLALNLVASATRIPDRVAAMTDDSTMTYAELDAASARLATLLEREGIGAGDRVGVMLPNVAAARIAYYGIWRLGAIVVPMNPLMQGREVQFYLSNSDSKALIGSPGFAGAARVGAEAVGAKLWLVDDTELSRLTAHLPEFGDLAERADSDTAVVLHTSGTTGTPKGAELTHGSLGSNQEVIVRRLLAAVPCVRDDLCDERRDRRRCRTFAEIVEYRDGERRPGSIGTPIEDVQVRLLDPDGNEVATGTSGEIQIKGPNVMKGYWNLSDATNEAIKDGWFSTGDIAIADKDGYYYYVVDRKKDLIIRGGYNVYPREVEEALHEHPGVAAVAVIGIPHESLGEEVGAAVVLKTGASAELDELRQFVKGRVAAYKYPRRIWFADTLPTGPTGKLLRREVKPPPEEA